MFWSPAHVRLGCGHASKLNAIREAQAPETIIRFDLIAANANIGTPDNQSGEQHGFIR
jgi:hypothetical protein